MEIKKFEYCRTCLNENIRNIRELQQSYKDDLKFIDLLTYLLGNCENSTDLPTFICIECEENLIQSYLFKKQCLESESRLLNIINEHYLNSEEIKYEQLLDKDIPEEDIKLARTTPIDKESVDETKLKDENISKEIILVNSLYSKENQPQDEISKISMGNRNSKIYNCRKCNLKFASTKEYSIHHGKFHRKRTGSARPTGCRKCFIKFKSRLEFSAHYDQVHSGKNNSQDKINNKSFAAENVSDKDDENLMLIQDSNISQENDRISEIVSNENEVSKLFCHKCNLKFKLRNDYLIHYQTVHRKEIIFLRDRGFKKYHDSSTKQKELLFESNTSEDIQNSSTTTINKWYGCGKCYIKFSSSEEYDEHYQKNHIEMRVCPKCGKLIKRPHYNQHQLTHSKQIEKVICGECGKTLSSSAALIRHMRIHTGERPYECKLCGKRFAETGTRNLHVLTHSNEKKHECHICNMKFQRKNCLNRHILVHTGEKNHECENCSRKFATKAHLRRHIKTHKIKL